MSPVLRVWSRWLLPACLAPGLLAADDPVDKVSKVASDWVRTRAETVRLENEWLGQRDILETMLKALEDRAQLAEQTVEETKAKTAQERGELETLEKKNDAAQAGLAQVATRLKALTAELLALRAALPPRLQVALTLPYRSLGNPELELSDRMQHAMTILNRCNQFNHTITAGEEVLTLPGETAKALDVVYWGLSQGYALDRAGHRAWLGRPVEGTWQWEATPDAFEQVSRILAIAGDKADPSYVVVPARLDLSSR